MSMYLKLTVLCCASTYLSLYFCVLGFSLLPLFLWTYHISAKAYSLPSLGVR